MAKKRMTDQEVRSEIERLQKSQYVKLARKEEIVRNRERQYMYQLRWYEKKGMALSEAGVTMEMLEEASACDDYDFCMEE